MAAALVAGRADVRVSCGDQAGGLHDEHDRVFEYDAAEGEKEPGAVPVGRSGLQADVSGLAQHHPAVDNADTELESGAQPVCYFVRRASADEWHRLKLTYTESNLVPRAALLALVRQEFEGLCRRGEDQTHPPPSDGTRPCSNLRR
jgi:hypothetical protein